METIFYSTKVLVKGKPVTEVDHAGNTYIEGRRNSEFEIQFKNHTPSRVLVIPSVDGLNTIDGKLCGVESQGYVVKPYGVLTIEGWTLNSESVAKFIFKDKNSKGKDQTYAEAMDSSVENQGLIGIMVFKEQSTCTYSTPIVQSNPWGTTYTNYSSNVPDNSEKWADESSSIRSCATTDDFSVCYSATPEPSMGTGFGESTKFKTTSTSFNRRNEPSQVFVFNYDSLKNMERIGVPVHQFKEHHSKPRPNPFPESPEVVSGCRIPFGWNG